jgi:F0F1-type ATP synthase membrane subunit a
VTTFITVIFGKPEKKQITVSIATERLNFFGLDISTTVLYTCASWRSLSFSLSLRALRRAETEGRPKGTQNVIETAIEFITKLPKVRRTAWASF